MNRRSDPGTLFSRHLLPLPLRPDYTLVAGVSFSTTLRYCLTSRPRSWDWHAHFSLISKSNLYSKGSRSHDVRYTFQLRFLSRSLKVLPLCPERGRQVCRQRLFTTDKERGCRVGYTIHTGRSLLLFGESYGFRHFPDTGKQKVNLSILVNSWNEIPNTLHNTYKHISLHTLLVLVKIEST